MQVVTKDMTIGEVIQKNPGSAEILMSFGMGCVCCPSALGETIEEAAMVHGIDADEIIKSLNYSKEENN
ncbi:disulfide oxidoreductase [Clostridium acetobutylicum]|nr:disulfide oxidoreductase [Clostridium acetobutylicum]